MKHPAPHEPVLTEEMRALRAAIIGLPEPLRDVFLLHGMAGLSYPEIAIHLGLETPAVQKMLADALIELLQATRLAGSHLNDGEATDLDSDVSRKASKVVRVAGLEPALLSKLHFECSASTIPPHPHRHAARGRSASVPSFQRGIDQERGVNETAWMRCDGDFT